MNWKSVGVVIAIGVFVVAVAGMMTGHLDVLPGCLFAALAIARLT